jgi:hypothetical protein
MSVLPVLRMRCEQTRTVRVDAGGFDVADGSVGKFPALLVPGARTVNAPNDSPRELPPGTLWFGLPPHGPPLASGHLYAAERVVDPDGTAWELLGAPRPLRAGSRIRGYAANVLPVSTLYPFLGDLTDQSGTTIAAAVKFAVWGASRGFSDQGDFENFVADFPPEYRDELSGRNVKLEAGGEIYSVVEANPVFDGPRVVGLLRMARG